MRRLRAWRIRRAEERIKDAEHHLVFLHYPSHVARQGRKIERLIAKRNRLRSVK